MKKEDFKLDEKVIVNVKSFVNNETKYTDKEGIIKGVRIDHQGNVKVQVEHLVSTITDFDLADVKMGGNIQTGSIKVM